MHCLRIQESSCHPLRIQDHSRRSLSLSISHRIDDPTDGGGFDESVYNLVTTSAYGEFYGCFEWVAPKVLSILFAHPVFWSKVAEYPIFFMQLAEKLRSSELYFDAMRHVFSKYSGFPLSMDHYNGLASALGIRIEDDFNHFAPIFREHHRCVDRLRDDIVSLQLTPYIYTFHKQRYHSWTSFLNALRFKEGDRGVRHHDSERTRHIAHTIFGQTVAQYLVSEEIYVNDARKARSRSLGGFSKLCDKLCKAAVSKHPARFVDFEAGNTLGRMFNVIAFWVKQDLDSLVRKAATKIHDAFKTCKIHRDGRTITYRRCNFDVSSAGFTYYPVDETKMPWTDERDWDTPPLFPEGLIFREAAPAVVAMLGKDDSYDATHEVIDKQRDTRILQAPKFIAGYEPPVRGLRLSDADGEPMRQGMSTMIGSSVNYYT